MDINNRTEVYINVCINKINTQTNHQEVNQVPKAPCSNILPILLPSTTFSKIHPAIKKLFCAKQPDVSLAGRLKHFLENWKKLTHDKHILQLVQGYEIPFFTAPRQRHVPTQKNIPMSQVHLVDKEIQSMLEKGAIKQVFPVKHQFPSNLFLVGKKDGVTDNSVSKNSFKLHFRNLRVRS